MGRIEALCPYFGSCGGCSYQNIPYQEQVEKKKELLISSIGFDEVKVFTHKPYFYRSRMDFVFHQNGLGLREKGKWWKVVDIEKCVIACEGINDMLKEVRSFFKSIDAFDLRKKYGTFRYAVMRLTKHDGSISFVLNKESKNLEKACEDIRKFSEQTSAKNIVITFVPPNRDVSVSEDFEVVKGNAYLEEEFLSKKFRYPIQGFFQNNRELAEKMHEYCRSLLESHKTQTLIDLYGGVGTFGIINADLFEKVYVVENYKPSIELAKENAKLNNAKNVLCFAEDAKNLKKIGIEKPCALLADPPRAGIHPKAIEYINKTKPEIFIYVSCNLRQLAHDIKILSEFEIKSAALFDFFPQTPHAEAVVEMMPKNNV